MFANKLSSQDSAKIAPSDSQPTLHRNLKYAAAAVATALGAGAIIYMAPNIFSTLSSLFSSATQEDAFKLEMTENQKIREWAREICNWSELDTKLAPFFERIDVKNATKGQLAKEMTAIYDDSVNKCFANWTQAFPEISLHSTESQVNATRYFTHHFWNTYYSVTSHGTTTWGKMKELFGRGYFIPFASLENRIQRIMENLHETSKNLTSLT